MSAWQSVGTCKNLPCTRPQAWQACNDDASGTGGTSCQLCLDIAPPNDRNQSKNNAVLPHLVSLQTTKKQADNGGQTHNSCTHWRNNPCNKVASRADLHGGNHYHSTWGVKQGDILAFRKCTWSTFSWHEIIGSHTQRSHTGAKQGDVNTRCSTLVVLANRGIFFVNFGGLTLAGWIGWCMRCRIGDMVEMCKFQLQPIGLQLTTG